MLALLRHIAKRTLGEEDLLQEVFLEAWLSAREYDPQRASVRAWLMVRARSRALDRFRRRARELSAQRELAHGVSAMFPATERQIAVGEALATLDPAVRTTLEFTFFEGMTALEIARQTQVPEGTVKWRLAGGLSLMERVLFQVDEGTR